MQSFPLNPLTFPLWWYTTGTISMASWVKKQLIWEVRKTAIILFARHLNEPLYGDYTKSGVIISFFLRIILLMYKSFLIILRGLFSLAVFCLYEALFPILIAFIIFQIF